MSLEELEQQPAEPTQEEGLSDEFGLGQIISELLRLWGERVEEGFGDKVALNEYEIKTVNMATNPIIKKLLARIGLEESYFLSFIAVLGIIVPHIIKIINEGRKQRKAGDSNGKDDKKEV